MKVAIRDHHGKGGRIAAALAAAGHEVGEDGPADLFLIDLDPPEFGYRDVIDAHRAAGAKIVLYPHGPTPALVYDGLFEPYEHVDASLVIGPGQAEYLRRIDYPHDVHAIGWSLCDILPFRACDDVRSVLFAPLHPTPHGHLADQFRELNTRVFERLVRGPWQVTVRHIGTVEQNGLWPVDGVDFVQGSIHLAFEEIDAADVVVAGHGTFPMLAIARGAPTVVYAGLLPAMYGFPDERPKPLRRLERYADWVHFPFDADTERLDDVIRTAARSDEPIAEFRRRFIGAPLDDAEVVALLERIVHGPSDVPRIAADGRIVLAFAEEVIERPELLERVTDGTLVLWAPGTTQRNAEALVANLTAPVPIVALGAPASAVADAALAARADAVLGDWPPVGHVGALPRC